MLGNLTGSGNKHLLGNLNGSCNEHLLGNLTGSGNEHLLVRQMAKQMDIISIWPKAYTDFIGETI